ncbi:MAG: ABC transporter [candidate division TM6 bacterium GW2011_GWF2_37_49]|nr:MAG: ABC transporter [candidate division TM6 bacterium GW2011_GWF2_37_49]
MKSLSLFVALRYLNFKGQDKNIAFMVKICFLGILIGTFSLMLTLIITNGFEKVIHEKMQGINSQIIITSPGNRLEYQDLRNVLLAEFNNEIKAVGARSLRQAILDKYNTQTVIFLQGVDGPNEIEISTIASKIISPLNSSIEQKNVLLKNIGENEIIIGHKTALNFNIKVGDNLKLLIPEPTSKKRLFLQKQQFKVVGIFNVGLEEYDNNFAFCSLQTINTVFNEEGIDQITIKLKNSNHETQQKTANSSFLHTLKTLLLSILFKPDYETLAIKKLKQRLPDLQITSWKELYPALVSSLKLEKYVMFFILALITLVASLNMISLLFMQIQQKRRDIAIFKALGMPNNQIRKIFLYTGMTVTFLASIAGLALAAAAGYFLEKYPIIELPDVYYVSYLPARMDLDIFIIVFLVTILIGFFATWLPSRQAKQVKIAQVLKQE